MRLALSVKTVGEVVGMYFLKFLPCSTSAEAMPLKERFLDSPSIMWPALYTVIP